MSENDALYKLRHSTAHVMAEAVMEIYPGTKIAIGPPVENGFYYDFMLPEQVSEDDFEKIEAKMTEIINRGDDFVKKVVSREEAKSIFSDQQYKRELIDDLPEGEEVSIYQSGSFTDLCKGPHVKNTSQINQKSFKLLKTAGAYWRGDENRDQLQRLYGTVWQNPKDLRKHLAWLKEVEQRDHRKIGKELDLFSMHEEAGPGLVYWHPKGAMIRHTIESFWKEEHLANGYELLYSPHVGKSWLWQTSGHLDFYKENMYSPIEMDKDDYYVKPMNCPFHIMMYNTSLRSYRELPLRWAELGTVYRYERSGVLHGLLRVRGFTQDDAHIICTPDQIEDEIIEVLRFSMRMWEAFGFKDIKAYVATKPVKSVGDPQSWNTARESLTTAIEKEGIDYEIDEGGGAFYGPKIDLKIKDALGREWQTTTIQFDFNLPERFDMTFVDTDGKEKRPFMVHRALLGSIERFFGILVEHYSGAFPLWLSPVQGMVIPVAPAFNEYAGLIAQTLSGYGLRVKNDDSDQRMNAKIRNAQNQKIPYMFIVGQDEMDNKAVSIRLRDGKQLKGIPIEEAAVRLQNEIAEKK